MNTSKSMNHFEKMPLVALLEYIDKLNERCEYIYSELNETQKLAAYANNPRYIFSFSFPPLYLVPSARQRNQIDSALNKVQIKYQDALSQALEANLVLNTRVEKVLTTFSEFYNNPLDQNQKDKIAKMTEIEQKEFVGYLHYQKYVLKRECQKQGETLAILQNSVGRFLGKQKNQRHLASFHLAQARESLKKIKKLEAFVDNRQSTLMKTPKAVVKRKDALWSAKSRPPQTAFPEKAPKPRPTSGSKKGLT